MKRATTKPKESRNRVGSKELVGRRVMLVVQTLRAYEERVSYWLKEAQKYPRASYGRREALAYTNAFCCMVDDLRLLVPAKHRQPPSNKGAEV